MRLAQAPTPRPVAAKDTLVLLDSDTASWSSWNRYGEQFARDTGARTVRIDDGGVTGPAFFEHVRRLRRPVINSPKSQNDASAKRSRAASGRAIPSRTGHGHWFRGAARSGPPLRAVINALTADMGGLGLDDDTAWLPTGDPHRLS